MTFRLGLTGSIGMGKSATARIFAEEGCAIWDADDTVHRLYAAGGAAVAPMAAAFPEAVVGGAVHRPALREIIQSDPDAIARIEQIVHPLVRADREGFAQRSGADIAVFDIPLLFETGAEAEMDAVACVHIDAATQRDRVLQRGTMTEQQLDTILAKQLPIDQKLARARFSILTDTPDHARAQVRRILTTIRKEISDA